MQTIQRSIGRGIATSSGRAFQAGVAARPACTAAPHSRRAVSVRAKYEPTTEYDYDLFTIGGGSGGVRASRISSGFGAKTACAEVPFGFISGPETGGLGGTCVLRGCVPKKLMLYFAEYAEHFRDAEGFGWAWSEHTFSWPAFMAKKREELKRLNGVYGGILDKADVEVIEGRATVVDPHTVEVNGKRYTSKYICVAVGGTPKMLDLPGVKEHCISSDGILELDEFPQRLAVIGGGYIGIEFAGMFNNMGTQVEIFIRGEKVLKGFDEEVRDFLTNEYKTSGIAINDGCSPKEVTKNEDGSLTLKFSTKDGGESSQVFDQVLFATGRDPNTKDIGLEAAGVKMDKSGFIPVDELSKTNVDSIYAVGDVTDRMALTPVALMEGMCMAKTLFNDQPTKPDHVNIATAVFSHPNMGTCGMTEEGAREEYPNLDVFTSDFRPMKNTISGNQHRAFMKLIVDTDSDRVLGIHMVGPEAGEIMQGFGAAMKCGITKTQLDSTIGIHPSSAEEFVTMRSPSRQIRDKKLVE